MPGRISRTDPYRTENSLVGFCRVGMEELLALNQMTNYRYHTAGARRPFNDTLEFESSILREMFYKGPRQGRPQELWVTGPGQPGAAKLGVVASGVTQSGG